MMLRPKFMLNSVGASVQLWEGLWPHTVITLWWGLPPKLRVLYWRGKTMGNRPPEDPNLNVDS